MFRRSILKLEKSATTALRRAYTSTPEQPVNSSAHKLVEEALAQKTGTAKSKATLPKGDKKPVKAKGRKEQQYKGNCFGCRCWYWSCLGCFVLLW